jgi:hypothetical protein
VGSDSVAVCRPSSDRAVPISPGARCVVTFISTPSGVGQVVQVAEKRDSLIYAGRKGSAVRYRKPDMPPDTLSWAEERRQGFHSPATRWRGGRVLIPTLWSAAIWRHEPPARAEVAILAGSTSASDRRPTAAEDASARCAPKCATGEPDKISAWRCSVTPRRAPKSTASAYERPASPA